MEFKIIKRSIPVKRENRSDNFRVKYNDPKEFGFLKVIITREADKSAQTFYFKSMALPESDSIHFTTEIKKNKLHIRWSGIEPLPIGWKIYSQKEIETIIEKAIKKLQKNDTIFLDRKFNINERTVTHRLAMYLSDLFPNENVDCEYNRMYNDDVDEYIAKNIELPRIENGLTLKDVEAKTVFPDIIVHRRKAQRNLLALEIKMQWKSKNGDFDLIKAEAYKRRLNYDFSAYLILGEDRKYELRWIK